MERKRVIGGLISTLIVIATGAAITTILLLDGSSQSKNKLAEYPVLLVSFDGFRDDYLTRKVTPNLNAFGRSGVRAEFLLSQFPTKTFPNHYTIVTGLLPESHGIVFNSFYDPLLKQRFSIRFGKDPEFWGGEPIWKTAEKNGLKSASFYWVGSEVEGLHPTYYKAYNQSVPAEERIKQVIEWLQLPEEERPSLIMMYFHQPDYSGHIFGPDSPMINSKIKVVDNIFGNLLSALDKINVSDSINMIVLSDHGMVKTDCNEPIFLDKYGVLENELYWNSLGAVASFSMKDSDENSRTLDRIKCVNDSFKAFNKRELPKRMHFSTNRRIDQTIVIGNSGKIITINSSIVTRKCSRGTHGYDNIAPDVKSIFMAKGPLFAKNKVVKYFTNIEIYNLLAKLLDIDPAPNNGTKGSLNSLLVNTSRSDAVNMNGDGTLFRTDICQFPNEQQLLSRSGCCNCSICTPQNIVDENRSLNLSESEVKKSQQVHAPWGLPEGGVGGESCLMTQRDFILGYNVKLGVPLWTVQNLTVAPGKPSFPGCSRYDVRLDTNQTKICESYLQSKFVMEPLENNGFIVNNVKATPTMSTLVPQYQNFNEGIWSKLQELSRSWSSKYGNVYDISGSIFDEDDDGLKDGNNQKTMFIDGKFNSPAVPTHFYKILTRCNETAVSEYSIAGCSGTLEVISFILKNTNETCLYHEWKDVLLLNVASVKDVELLTGTNFFPSLPSQLQAEMKSFLPVKLWL